MWAIENWKTENKERVQVGVAVRRWWYCYSPSLYFYSSSLCCFSLMLFQHTHIRSRIGRKTEEQWNRQQQSQSSYNLTFSTQKLDSFSFFFCIFVSIPHYFYCYCFGSLTLPSIFFLAAVAHRTRTYRLGLSTFPSQMHRQSSSVVIHFHPMRPEKVRAFTIRFLCFPLTKIIVKGFTENMCRIRIIHHRASA